MSEARGVKPSLLELALTFNHISLASFGGGLSAWSREVVVVEKKWMSEEEFLSILTMCRILPGANQVNVAIFVGAKFLGLPGAIAAVFGLTFLPAVLILVLGAVYFHYSHVPALQNALKGAAAGAIALTLSMVFKTGRKCLHGAIPWLLFTATFFLNGVLRWPLFGVLALTAPLALLWAWPKTKTQ
jgi:chromate transporter